jgi:structural maintenance of chromosome 2
LQELVYKQGQAGITKASVSITFNNSDKSRSPVGYEQCDSITVTRQIVIGGKNKYMINGSVAQPTRVQNLFHSVQLNVNNPHFLIMQGRITKVLNMKPPEILGMLEEAAGTRMYESKKEAAMKTLQKKELKVQEIDQLLEEEILPTIEKLRKERGEYMKWASANDTLERLRRFCVAIEFCEAEEASENAQKDANALKDEVDLHLAKSMEAKCMASEIDQKIQEAIKIREAQCGEQLVTAKLEVELKSKELVKNTSAMEAGKKELSMEELSMKKLEKQKSDAEQADIKRASKVKDLEREAESEHNEFVEAEESLARCEKTLMNVQTGAGNASDNKSLQTQLAEAIGKCSECDAKMKSETMRVKHAEKELAQTLKVLSQKQKDNLTMENEMANANEQVLKCKQSLAEFDGCDDELFKSLESKKKSFEQELEEKRETVDQLAGKLAGLDFKFKNPDNKFDRSKVKGTIAKLFDVIDENTMTALEVVAGGKLYQVVVDSANTGKALLERGQLQKRVTIVPLDKVDGRAATQSQIDAATKVSNSDAKLAVSLVTAKDQDVQQVLNYVFGRAFVCTDSNVAKKVAFDKNVLLNCVTVEGDLLNPTGLLTGGSRGTGQSVLKKLRALSEAEDALNSLQTAIASLDVKINASEAERKKYQQLEVKLDQAEHKQKLLQEKNAESEVYQLEEKKQKLEVEIEECSENVSLAKQVKEEASLASKRLQSEIENFAKERDNLLKEAEKNVKLAKTRVSDIKDLIKKKEAIVLDARVEKEASLKAIESLRVDIESAREQIEQVKEHVKTLEGENVKAKEMFDRESEKLLELTNKLRETDQEIAKFRKRKQVLEQQHLDEQCEAKKLTFKIEQFAKACAEAKTRLCELEKEHQWATKHERQLFGKADSEYDFKKRDCNKAKKQLQDAEEQQKQLGKRVNKKVIAMFDKAESEFKQLQEKRRIVLNDRSKIEKVINELDEKKRETLELVWRKVTQDFGSIFSTLLPGTRAKLEPVEGTSFLDGLEVKVAFGEVWKESLSELSGGQKSLLALSLILALLLFKPAPIYILDEVDAALDLSHTQNIGRMIRTHFPFSQFIVVSLKEGMFNNANVIFRTKFVDGLSTVSRTAPALKDKVTEEDKADGGALGAAAQKRANKAAHGKENAH